MWETYKISLTTQKFKLNFIILIIMTAFAVFGICFDLNYIEGFLAILSSQYYIILIIMIILVNTLNVLEIFEKNQNVIIRYKNKLEYMKELIRNVLFSNFMIIILNFILLLIGMNLFIPNSQIELINGYQITNLTYLIYTITKFVMLLEIISIINIIIIKLFDSKLSLVINIIFFVSMFTVHVPESINSLLNMRLVISDYFMSIRYISFPLEISIFALYISITIALLALGTNIVSKKIRTIGE